MRTIVLGDSPSLIRPFLICAFGGWGDAGRAPTMSVQHLIASWNATKFADVDSDELYDLTSSRPWVGQDANGQRHITWPSTSFFAHHDPNGEMDAILVLGPEPSYHWKTFSADVVELARALDVRMAVTLGAYPAHLSHQNPVPLSGWAYPEALQERLKTLDVSTIAYEGPTNLVTVLGCALADAKIPVAALWAGLPAYLGATPNPKGALALVDVIDRAFGLGLDSSKLRQASDDFERSVTQALKRVTTSAGPALLLAPGEEPSALAGPIETAGTDDDVGELPSADEAIQTAEDFLRRNREK